METTTNKVTMRAAVLDRFGGIDALRVQGAFGVASSFPYVLGWNAAGTVAAVGERVGTQLLARRGR